MNVGVFFKSSSIRVLCYKRKRVDLRFFKRSLGRVWRVGFIFGRLFFWTKAILGSDFGVKGLDLGERSGAGGIVIFMSF